MPVTIRLFLALLPLCLAGCVSFERAPAALACDARLQGRWIPVANDATEAAKLTADDHVQVDGQCRATVSMSQAAGTPPRQTTVTAQGFAWGSSHYLALAPGDVAELFSGGAAGPLPQAAKEGGVTLVRYRIEGDELAFTLADLDTVKRLAAKGAIAARSPDQMNYLVTGDEKTLKQVLLEHPEIFTQGSSPPMTMRRARADAAP